VMLVDCECAGDPTITTVPEVYVVATEFAGRVWVLVAYAPGVPIMTWSTELPETVEVKPALFAGSVVTLVDWECAGEPTITTVPEVYVVAAEFAGKVWVLVAYALGVPMRTSSTELPGIVEVKPALFAGSVEMLVDWECAGEPITTSVPEVYVVAAELEGRVWVLVPYDPGVPIITWSTELPETVEVKPALLAGSVVTLVDCEWAGDPTITTVPEVYVVAAELDARVRILVLYAPGVPMRTSSTELPVIVEVKPALFAAIVDRLVDCEWAGDPIMMYEPETYVVDAELDGKVRVVCIYDVPATEEEHWFRQLEVRIQEFVRPRSGVWSKPPSKPAHRVQVPVRTTNDIPTQLEFAWHAAIQLL
jgi:hypothetical protein